MKPPSRRDVTGLLHDSPTPNEVLLPGLVSVERSFDVPLDHDNEAGKRITVFARELAGPEVHDLHSLDRLCRQVKDRRTVEIPIPRPGSWDGHCARGG
jgi:hypothetical protein